MTNKNQEIKKAIIPVAGLGTRFLPLSKVVPKELWPLVEKPVIQYIVEEVKNSGIEEIIFVISPDKKLVLDYFKKCPKIEKILKERKRVNLISELEELDEICKKISFSYVFQKKPLGDGHALLQAAEKLNKEESAAVLWADDVVESSEPAILQLMNVFKTCQKPVLALYKLPKEKLSSYGVVEVEKIADRLYKIKKIVEKPELGQAPSNLAVVGKYVLTPEVFEYLKKAKPGPKKEILLAEVFDKMISDGKVLYGCEFEGKWLECGSKASWLESNTYLSLKHQKYGENISKLIKK